MANLPPDELRNFPIPGRVVVPSLQAGGKELRDLSGRPVSEPLK